MSSQDIACLREIVAAKAECAQVVICLGIVRLCGYNLQEGFDRLVKIAMLEHCHAVSKFVPRKSCCGKSPLKRQSLLRPFVGRDRN